MGPVKNFFLTPAVIATCKEAMAITDVRYKDLNADNPVHSCYRLIGVFMYYAAGKPAIFDSNMTINIDAIGDAFLECLREYVKSNGDSRDQLFVYCYRMGMEFEISFSGDAHMDFIEVVYNARNYVDELSGVLRFQAEYAGHQMVIQVAKSYLNHPDMAKLVDLPSTIRMADKKSIEFRRALDEREARVNSLKDTLESYKHAFNFVGLYDGFKRLRDDKEWQANRNLMFLVVLGFAMLAIPISKIYGFGLTVVVHDYEYYAAMIGVEFFLVFMFRVSLHNFKAIKAQLLQIDLRMTLCQFIQDYAKYAEEIRAKDKELLVQFEKIIFSGIVNSEDAIPSTFDGLEKIAELIKAVKTK